MIGQTVSHYRVLGRLGGGSMGVVYMARDTRRERLEIDWGYEVEVTGDLEAARKIYELWAQTYPPDPVPHNELDVIYSNLGEYDKALAANLEALIDNLGLARHQAQAALALSKGRDVEGISAIGLGLAGDSDQALRLAADLDKRFPKDTWAQSEFLPMIRAAAILGSRSASKNGLKAVEALAHF